MTKLMQFWRSVGVAGLVIVVAIAVIFLLLAMQLRQRELSALQSTRTVVKAAANYHAKFGKYAPSLQDLATYEDGWCEGYATETVFTGKYYGYRFSYEAPVSSTGSRDKFFLSVVPYARENTNAREFCADQTGAIRMAKKGTTCSVNSQDVRDTDDLGRLRLP